MTGFLPLAMAITDFGESTVVVTTTLAASGWFWLSHQRRLAVLWLFVMGGCAATMVVLKLGFLTCGHLVLDGTVLTPSGHSSMAALFYGAAALTLERVSPSVAKHRSLVLTAAFLFALLIGATRVVILAHTPQEVVAGLAVGFGWLICFAVLLRRIGTSVAIPPAPVLFLLALLYAGLLTFTMIGEHMTVEGLLQQIAHLLQTRWGVCAS